MLKSSVFTIVQNEPVFLPIWLKHYRRHFDACDIFVINHELPDSHPDKPAWQEWIASDRNKHGYNLVPIRNDDSFDHEWLCNVMMDWQRKMLGAYDVTLLTEVDEIVDANPEGPYPSLREYIQAEMPSRAVRTCWGYEVVHKYDEESAIDLERPLLAQRKWWYPSSMYSKPVLCREPQVYCQGFHASNTVPLARRWRDPNLLMIHLHKMDFPTCLERNRANARRKWSPDQAIGSQNRLIEEERLKRWWWINVDQSTERSCLELIPDSIKTLV